MFYHSLYFYHSLFLATAFFNHSLFRKRWMNGPQRERMVSKGFFLLLLTTAFFLDTVFFKTTSFLFYHNFFWPRPFFMTTTFLRPQPFWPQPFFMTTVFFMATAFFMTTIFCIWLYLSPQQLEDEGGLGIIRVDTHRQQHSCRLYCHLSPDRHPIMLTVYAEHDTCISTVLIHVFLFYHYAQHMYFY